MIFDILFTFNMYKWRTGIVNENIIVNVRVSGNKNIRINLSILLPGQIQLINLDFLKSRFIAAVSNRPIFVKLEFEILTLLALITTFVILLKLEFSIIKSPSTLNL